MYKRQALASLLILISGLALALSGDTFTLNITDLTNKHVSGSLALLSYLGFLIGFGVKLPIFPLHTWLPDAHGERLMRQFQCYLLEYS